MQVNKPEVSSQEIGSNQTTRYVADLLLAYLHQLNIDYVFGSFEDSTHTLTNSFEVSARESKTRHVETQHVASAVTMAAGYAENTGKLGVCMAGTAAINHAIAELTTAYQNETPLLFITLAAHAVKQTTPHTQFDSQHALAMAGCTAQSYCVYQAADFENILSAAILAAKQANQPVHLHIAAQVLETASTVSKPRYQVAKHIAKTALLDKQNEAEFEAILLRSKKIVFILGVGARRGIKEILAFASINDADILSTASGKGYINSYHERYRGTLHQTGHRSASEALRNASNELYIAVGVAPAEWQAVLTYFSPAMSAKLIHIDARAAHFTYTPMAKLHVQADANELFAHILLASKTQRLLDNTHSNTVTFDSLIKENKYKYYFTLNDAQATQVHASQNQVGEKVISPQKLLQELPQLFPPKTRYVVESGQCQQWAIHYLHPHDRRLNGHRDDKAGLYQARVSNTVSGWSVNHALGTSLAFSDTPVICITDAASFLNHCADVTLAVKEQLSVVFVIFNHDKSMQYVPGSQKPPHGTETTTATGANKTDFALLGEALNIVSHAIDTHQDLLYLPIKDICKRRGPTLIDVRL